MRGLGANTRAVMTAVAAAALVLGTAGAAPSDEIEVPIKGQVLTGGTQPEGAPAVLTIHGVRRMDNATIVYWSVAKPEGNTSTQTGEGFLGADTTAFYQSRVGPKEGDVALIDGVGLKAYRPLAPPGIGDPCVCSQGNDLLKLQPGQALVQWSGVAPLPPDVTTVDVSVGEQVVSGVPVEDGPLEPLAKEQDGPIVVGMGWPEIPSEALAAAKPLEPAFYPLVSRISNLEQSVTTTQDSVSLAADVLFAKDSATLTAKAQGAIAAAAAEIKKLEGAKALKVTGHADSDAADAYNLTLSKQRAAAVAAALGKALGGGYTITSEGKGETEPIASNKTDAGKAKNRRVTITVGGQ